MKYQRVELLKNQIFKKTIFKIGGLWKWAKQGGHAKVEEIGLMGIWKMGMWWALEVGQERWPCKGGLMGIWKLGMWCREITGQGVENE